MTVIASIPKNSREEIRITREDFKGTDLVSLRVYFQADDNTMRPSKKGIAFKASLLPEVMNALKTANDPEVQQ